jgi:hypothetical protein
MQNTNVISMEGFNLSEEVMEQCNAFIEKHTDNKRADASFSRQIKAWINHAHRTKQTPASAGLTLSETSTIFVPDLDMFTAFAADTLVNEDLAKLDGYITALNKAAASQAQHILKSSIAEPEKSELLAKLTDNQGKPWSIASIHKVQDIYRELRFAREFASKIKGPDPTPADLGSGTRKRRRKSTQAKATSIATPIKVLDKMLNDADLLVVQLASLREQSEPAETKGSGKKAAQEAKRAAAVRESTIKALESKIGCYAACFLQLVMMARASTVGGNLQFNANKEGIHADLQVTDAGLTYIIRFLKGWRHGVHAFRGETLPIHRDGSDTVPWDEVHSPRNRVLTLLKYAQENKLMGSMNRNNPETTEAVLNAFLRQQSLTDLLKAEQKITSHR